MLADAHLGNEFWGYAMLAATHILNRMPSRAHEGRSPIEVWTGAKPLIVHFRVFGCPVHVLVPAETRRKLDPKSVTCTFVGYAEDQGTRVYKLYHEETKRVITSRDVVFDEFPSEERAEETKLSAGKGLASTPLNQLIPKKRLISKHNQLSQCGEELISQRKGPPTPGIRLPSSTESSPLSSVYSDDGLEETITVRGPVLPLPSASTRATSSPGGQGNMTSSNESMGEQSTSRRPQRTRKPVEYFKPATWKAMVAHTNEEPATLGDAISSEKSVEWLAAWESELRSLEDNGTWVIENLPEGSRTIGCRWIFKRKEDGRYKARLVAKGYAQKAGIDFHETFAPVAKFTTLRTLLALAAENDWEIEGMDVQTAFLHGELAEVIYMEIPEGLKQETWKGTGDSPKQACRLITTIYGLKQALRAWYRKINKFFSESGFTRSNEDHSLYVHRTRRLIILLYVDDLVLAASTLEDISWIKKMLRAEFEMTDLGELTSFIGVQITRDRRR